MGRSATIRNRRELDLARFVVNRANCQHPSCDWKAITERAARRHAETTGHPVYFERTVRGVYQERKRGTDESS